MLQDSATCFLVTRKRRCWSRCQSCHRFKRCWLQRRLRWKNGKRGSSYGGGGTEGIFQEGESLRTHWKLQNECVIRCWKNTQNETSIPLHFYPVTVIMSSVPFSSQRLQPLNYQPFKELYPLLAQLYCSAWFLACRIFKLGYEQVTNATSASCLF